MSTLPISGSFAPWRPRTAGAEAEADIDRVGEHGLAGAGRGHEDVEHQRPHGAARRVIGPDGAVGPPEQHRAALPGRGGAVPGEHGQRIAQQAPAKACPSRPARGRGRCSSRPRGDRRRRVVVLQLPQPSIRWPASTRAAAASGRSRPAPRWRRRRAAHTEICRCSDARGAAPRRPAADRRCRKHDRNVAPISLNGIAAVAAALDHDGGAPRNPVLAQRPPPARRRGADPPGRSPCRPARIHSRRSRHAGRPCVTASAWKIWLADRRPQQMLMPGS